MLSWWWGTRWACLTNCGTRIVHPIRAGAVLCEGPEYMRRDQMPERRILAHVAIAYRRGKKISSSLLNRV